MIYAPPYLIRRPVSKVKPIDHELATSPTVTPIAHKTANTGKQATVAHYYYGAPHDQKASHDTATRYGSIVENGY